MERRVVAILAVVLLMCVSFLTVKLNFDIVSDMADGWTEEGGPESVDGSGSWGRWQFSYNSNTQYGAYVCDIWWNGTRYINVLNVGYIVIDESVLQIPQDFTTMAGGVDNRTNYYEVAFSYGRVLDGHDVIVEVIWRLYKSNTNLLYDWGNVETIIDSQIDFITKVSFENNDDPHEFEALHRINFNLGVEEETVHERLWYDPGQFWYFSGDQYEWTKDNINVDQHGIRYKQYMLSQYAFLAPQPASGGHTGKSHCTVADNSYPLLELKATQLPYSPDVEEYVDGESIDDVDLVLWSELFDWDDEAPYRADYSAQHEIYLSDGVVA